MHPLFELVVLIVLVQVDLFQCNGEMQFQLDRHAQLLEA